jgi:hypothetical protein
MVVILAAFKLYVKWIQKSIQQQKLLCLYKGKSKLEVWDSLTKMFSLGNSENIKAKTFIYGGFHFEEKAKSVKDANITATGDVFKALSNYGNPIYVTIVAWNPADSFSYDEQLRSQKYPARPTDPDRTNFNLIEHPEGTIVEIIRRERGKISLLDFLSGRGNRAGWAAGRFCHILTGDFHKFKKDNESRFIGGYPITRYDSLRNEF